MTFHTRRPHTRWVLVFTCCVTAGVEAAMAQNPEISNLVVRNTARDTLPANRPRETKPETDVQITVKKTNVALRDIIQEIAKQARLDVSYGTAETLLSQKVSVTITKQSLREALAIATRGTGVLVTFAPDGKSLIVQRTTSPRQDTQEVRPTGRVTGRVTDTITNNGIADVAVSVVGTSIQAVTTMNGDYVIDHVPAGDQTLSFRLLGFRTASLRVSVPSGGQTRLMVRLAQTASVLSGVVTTAVGQQRRAEVASDIARIDAAAVMERAPVRNLTDLLEAAQVPGVLISRSSGEPGSPTRIRMRGIGSVTQNNDPIVIVDGAWINAAMSTTEVENKAAGTNFGKFAPARIDNIDPSSIETIEIIRGPSAATLYGPDAANGVIVITTKKGKNGPTRWDFTYNRDWNSVVRNKPVKYIGFGQAISSTFDQGCGVAEVAAGRCRQDSVAFIDVNSPLMMDEGTGITHDYRLGLNGGASQIQYAANLSHQDQLGVQRISPIDQIRLRKLDVAIPSTYQKPNRFKRSGLSTRLSMQPNQRLTLDVNLGVTQNDKIGKAFSLSTFDALDPRDTISVLAGSGDVGQIEDKQRSTTGNVTLQTVWTPLSALRALVNAGVERTTWDNGSMGTRLSCATGVCAGIPGSRGGFNGEQSTYSVRLQLTGTVPLGQLERFVSVKPSWGTDIKKAQSTSSIIQADGIPYNATDFNSATYLSLYPGKTANATAGWYVNTTVGLLERLYFDVGVRRDIGSAISQASGNPKIGTSWVISNERFFPEFNWLSTLRLRAAFGRAAIQPDATDLYGQYVRGQGYINGSIVPTIEFNGLGNPRLIPGRSTELEFGFDADLLDNRVSITLTSSRKVNDNDLISRGVGPSTGFPSGNRKENIGRVINRGAEFSLTGRLIDNDFMLLSITTSMSMLDNQVQRLGDRVEPFGSTGAKIVAGYPVSGVWRFPLLGYADLNGDGVLGENEIIRGDTVVYYGWVQPRYSGGYNATLSIMNRTLVFNASVTQQGKYTQTSDFKSEYGLQSIHASFPEQAYSIIGANDGAGVPQTVSDVRFQSASITYYLPKRLLGRVGGRLASISLQGKNLALWTQYSGRDPGVNSNPVGETLVDNGREIPPPRQFNLSINLGF